MPIRKWNWIIGVYIQTCINLFRKMCFDRAVWTRQSLFWKNIFKYHKYCFPPLMRKSWNCLKLCIFYAFLFQTSVQGLKGMFESCLNFWWRIIIAVKNDIFTPKILKISYLKFFYNFNKSSSGKVFVPPAVLIYMIIFVLSE